MDGFTDHFTVIFGFIYHETLTFVDFHTTRVIVVYKIWPAFTFAASLLQLFVFFCECINHFPPAPHKAALQLCLCNHLLIQKQLCLHDHLTGTGAAANTSDSGMSFSGTSGPIPFQASRGWFDCLKKCDGLHNVKLTGIPLRTMRQLQPSLFNSRSSLRRKSMHQSNSSMQTRLPVLGKKMPTWTFISKWEKTASGVNAAKDRISLLLCANTKGDCMIKLVVLYHSLNPHSGQKEAHSAHILESQQKGVGNSCHLHGLGPQLFRPLSGEILGSKETLLQGSSAGG